MKRLIQRYLLSLEKSRNQSVAPPERLDEQELRDLITRLQDALRRREESKHAADAIKRQAKVSDESSLLSLMRDYLISEVFPYQGDIFVIREVSTIDSSAFFRYPN